MWIGVLMLGILKNPIKSNGNNIVFNYVNIIKNRPSLIIRLFITYNFLMYK